jgi:hypothetical protein
MLVYTRADNIDLRRPHVVLTENNGKRLGLYLSVKVSRKYKYGVGENE